jgi:hypothetical protein
VSIEKPSSSEEEYFAREFGETARREREQASGTGRARLATPWMLAQVRHGAVETNRRHQSPVQSCAGVWLDAGELEQVVQADAGFLGGFLRVFRR